MAVYKVLIVVVKIMNPKDYFYLIELLMLRKTACDILFIMFNCSNVSKVIYIKMEFGPEVQNF